MEEERTAGFACELLAGCCLGPSKRGDVLHDSNA